MDENFLPELVDRLEVEDTLDELVENGFLISDFETLVYGGDDRIYSLPAKSDVTKVFNYLMTNIGKTQEKKELRFVAGKVLDNTIFEALSMINRMSKYKIIPSNNQVNKLTVEKTDVPAIIYGDIRLSDGNFYLFNGKYNVTNLDTSVGKLTEHFLSELGKLYSANAISEQLGVENHVIHSALAFINRSNEIEAVRKKSPTNEIMYGAQYARSL